MTTEKPEAFDRQSEKPVLPLRIPGPLECEADRYASDMADKNPRRTYEEYLEIAIDRLGRDKYNDEVFNTSIDQALRYISMTREEVEATGHQLGALLPKVALGKTPEQIREWLSKSPEASQPYDPKADHMARQALRKGALPYRHQLQDARS